MRGTLKHRTLPSGSKRPDWEGYVDIAGMRYQLIGWSRADGAISLRQEGATRIESTAPAQESSRGLPAKVTRAHAQVDRMYRR